MFQQMNDISLCGREKSWNVDRMQWNCGKNKGGLLLEIYRRQRLLYTPESNAAISR